MSRVGKVPIPVPGGVEITISGQQVTVKGPKGSLQWTFEDRVGVEVIDGRCVVTRVNDERRSNRYWTGADLVVEVVSPDDPDRDYITKRADYAEAAIPEYWIVDPQQSRITVLTLTGDTYTTHGEFHPGDTATSPLLPSFTADVTHVLEGA